MGALSMALVLGALGMAAGLSVQTQTWASQQAAAEEVIRLCDAGDMDGALGVLEAHGKPIGFEAGKHILKNCFIEEVNGDCYLGKAKCAWMKQCIASEGACEQPPIHEAFMELPGGQAVLQELQAETNSSTSAPISKLVDAAKKITMAMRAPSALLQTKTETQAGAAEIDPAQAALTKLKKTLGMMNGLRNAWYEYLPEPFQRRFAVEAVSLPMWARIACATTFTQKFDEATGKPLYGSYAPLGEAGPKYTAPLYDMKFSKANNLKDWVCQYPAKLKKWQKREIAEVTKKKIDKIDESLPGPQRKIYRKYLAAKKEVERPMGIPDKDPTYRAMAQR